MNRNQKYLLNPGYILVNDEKRVFITNSNSKGFSDTLNTDFLSPIHPVQAMLLSFFNGKDTLNEIIKKISFFFDFTEIKTLSIIERYIENASVVDIEYDGRYYSFPKQLIIRNLAGNVRDYKPEDFLIEPEEMDYDSSRLNKPLDATFVVNTNCVTDCIYCYANRAYYYVPIQFNDLSRIFKEARELGMRNIDISGGELFLSKNWEQILIELKANGFNPYISTKIPIGLKEIEKLRNIGIEEVQISIDTLEKDKLSKILGVNGNYYEKIKETLLILDNEGFKIKTNTILTRENSSISEVSNLLDYLTNLKNILHINFSPAGFSMYKSDFKDFKAELKNLEAISKLVSEIKLQNPKFGIDFNTYLVSEDFNCDAELKRKNFANRAKCTANIENFIILPDGKVTICEELYWHPSFIVGDLTKQTIKEVWNSREAINLYELSKQSIQEKSPCKRCDDFDSCRKMPGVCWKFVIEAYGNDNWDFPDPRCHFAPKPKNEFYY